MHPLEFCAVVQFCLAFGVAGLFWPEKLKPVFEVLMFPWAASYRGIRANALAAIGLYTYCSSLACGWPETKSLPQPCRD